MNVIKLTASSVAGNVVTDFLANGDTEILYGEIKLTTDATVANRTVIVAVYDDAGTPALFADWHTGAYATASATWNIDVMPGIYRETAFLTTAANTIQVPVPNRLIIPNGYTLRISVDAGVAGDSYSAKFIALALGKHNVRC